MKWRTKWLWPLLAVALVVGGCATPPLRVAYNTVDSLNSAVNAAERVWSSYQVRQAKAALEAEGVVTPSKEQIVARVMAGPDAQRIEKLDADYRASAAALVSAGKAAQALRDAGEAGVLDPKWRAEALAAANRLIDAIGQLTNTKLKEAK